MIAELKNFMGSPSRQPSAGEPKQFIKSRLVNGPWMFCLLVMFSAVRLGALDLPPLGQALKGVLPAGDKTFQTTLKIDANQARELAGGYRAGETFTVFYTKDAMGRVTGRALELKEILVKYGVLHRWVIGMTVDGTLSGVTVTKLGDAHAYPVADARFQAQFSGKDPLRLRLGAGVDAMTGATDSSQLLVDSVGRAQRLMTWADCR